MLRTVALNFPKSVLIETCTACNAECGFCPYPIYRKGERVQYLDKIRFVQLIDELSEYDVQRITLFCNNEPLLDKRLSEFVAITRSVHPKAEITLSTNGKLLNQKIASELHDSGLDVLYVSVPTLDPIEYKKLMKYPLNRILDNLESVFKTPAKSMIRIAVPETYAYNREAFDEYFGSRQVLVSSWAVEYRDSWNLFDFMEMSSDQVRPPKKPCDRPLDQTCILADGNMILCCRDWGKDCSIGNIYNSTIYDLWHSDKMVELQQLIIKGEYNQIGICKDCSENPHNF